MIQYSNFAVPPLITSLLVAAIGIFTIVKNPKRMPNLLFGSLCIASTVWLFSYSVMYSSGNPSFALESARIGFMGIAFIPTFAYHFILTHLRIKSRVIPLLYGFSVIGLLVSHSDLIYESVRLHPWGYYPAAGKIYAAFLILFALLFSHGVWLLYKHSRVMLTERRYLDYQQTVYVLFAFMAGATGLVDYVAKYPIPIYPWGYLSALALISIVAYAILTVKLFEIDILLYQLVSTFGFLLATATFVFLGMRLTEVFLGEQVILSIPFSMAIAMMAGIFAFLVFPLRRGIDFLSERWILRGKYKYLQNVQNFLLHGIHGYLAIPVFQSEVRRILMNEWGISPVHIFLPGDYVKGGHKWASSFLVWDPRESYEEQSGAVIAKDSPEMKLLCQGGILTFEDVDKNVKDEAIPSRIRERFERLRECMSELQAEVIIPLFFSSENDRMLTSIVALGSKSNGGHFTQSDHSLLHLFYEEAPRAFYNALMHERDTLVGKKQSSLLQELGDLYRTAEGEREKYKQGYDKAIDLTSKLAYTTQLLRETQEELKKAERVAATARMSVTLRHEVNNAIAPTSMAINVVKSEIQNGEFSNKDRLMQNLVMAEEGISRVTKLMRDLETMQDDPAVKEYLPGVEMVDIEGSTRKKEDENRKK